MSKYSSTATKRQSQGTDGVLERKIETMNVEENRRFVWQDHAAPISLGFRACTFDEKFRYELT
jgi:hypothetical protein